MDPRSWVDGRAPARRAGCSAPVLVLHEALRLAGERGNATSHYHREQLCDSAWVKPVEERRRVRLVRFARGSATTGASESSRSRLVELRLMMTALFADGGMLPPPPPPPPPPPAVGALAAAERAATAAAADAFTEASEARLARPTRCDLSA